MLRRDAVYRIFNDDVMIGLVAVLALAVIFPIFDHNLSEGMKVILDYVNYIIIAAFIAEYVLKLYVERQVQNFIHHRSIACPRPFYNHLRTIGLLTISFEYPNSIKQW